MEREGRLGKAERGGGAKNGPISGVGVFVSPVMQSPGDDNRSLPTRERMNRRRIICSTDVGPIPWGGRPASEYNVIMHVKKRGI